MAAIGKVTKKHDELYTPRLLVEPILNELIKFTQKFRNKYNRDPVILCPFDTKESEFVSAFSTYYKVKFGHLFSGQDFFTHDYGEWDVCISNPPFSKKLEVFKKLDEMDKPWAMVMNAMALNYHEIINYFVNNEPEIMFFDKRVSYDSHPSSFGSCYICRNFLSKKIICVSLSNNNTGKYYTPSGMYKSKISFFNMLKIDPPNIVRTKVFSERPKKSAKDIHYKNY